MSISKKETSLRFVACRTKSSDISKRNLESGFRLLNKGVAGLIGVQAEIILARRLPRLAILLPLWGVPVKNQHCRWSLIQINKYAPMNIIP